MESFNAPQEEPKQINLDDYEGRVVLEDGKYKTVDGVNLTEKDGELYVSEGENDEGTRLNKKDTPIIPSGY